MVFTSVPLTTFQPISVIMPSVLIALIMIAFVGDGPRDALDPQSGGRR
jgi:ABC-type dipeptide/oligopeptide/nickel transport system permease subunit